MAPLSRGSYQTLLKYAFTDLLTPTTLASSPCFLLSSLLSSNSLVVCAGGPMSSYNLRKRRKTGETSDPEPPAAPAPAASVGEAPQVPASLPLPPTAAVRRKTTNFKRGSLWMMDGNIVIKAGRVRFRVHKSVLSLHSPVFRDMLQLPPPPSEANKFPTVELHDDPKELEIMLKFLYNS